MASNIDINLNARTSDFEAAIGRATTAFEKFASQGRDASRSLTNSLKMLKNDGKKEVDDLQKAFNSLSIKSDMGLRGASQAMTNAVKFYETQFNIIKNSGTASAAEIERAYAAMNAKIANLQGGGKTLSEPIDKATKSMNLFGLASIGAIVKIQLLYSAVNTLMSALGRAPSTAIEAIESYNSSIIGNAAMLTSMQSGVKDVGKAYQENKVYAEAVEKVLLKMDTETAASAKNLRDMNTVLVQNGVILDTNNKKQVQGFKDIANALSAITANDPNKDMQFSQEMRGLMDGTMKEGNRLFKLLVSLDPLIKDHIAGWMKIGQKTEDYGIVLEKIGPLLKGFAAAQGDINNLWETVKSTMSTIYNEILRGGLSKGFGEIVASMKEMSKWAEDNKVKIQTWLQDAYIQAKGLAQMFVSVGKAIAYLGEPGIWAAITLGLIPVAAGIRTIAAEVTVATAGINLLIAGLLSVGALTAKNYFSEKDLNKRVANIRNAGKYESADFTPNMLKDVLKVRPMASDADINKWLKSGALSIDVQNGQQVFRIFEDRIKVLEAQATEAAKPQYPKGIVVAPKKQAGGASEPASKFDSIVSGFESLTKKGEDDEMLRKIFEIDTTYEKTLKEFNAEKEKSKLLQKGITAETLETARAEAEARAIHESANKEFDKWFEDDIKQGRKQIEEIKKNAQEKKAIADSEARNAIANIEELQKFGEITDAQAADAMLVQYAKILDAQKTFLESINRADNPQGWLTQQHEIDRTKEKMLSLKKVMFDATPVGGMVSGFKEYAKQAEDIGNNIKNATSKAMKGMEDALVNFVKTGKMSFKDLADSIISDLIRIMVQKSITGPLAGAAGSAIGGIGSWIGGLFQANGGAWSNGVQMFANGGIVSRPTAFGMANGGTGVMGEAGEEGIFPLKRSSDGKLGVIALGANKSQGTPNIIINIENQTDSKVEQKQGGATFDGENWVVSMILSNVEKNGPLRGLMAGSGAF